MNHNVSTFSSKRVAAADKRLLLVEFVAK